MYGASPHPQPETISLPRTVIMRRVNHLVIAGILLASISSADAVRLILT